MPTPDSSRPILALTMGDPAGVGAEVVLKALQVPTLLERCRPLVIGDLRQLQRASEWVDWSPPFEVVEEPAEGRYAPGSVTLLDLENAPPSQCPPGRVSRVAGKAAVDYVCRACDLAMAEAVEAVVTAPLNKEAMNLAGHHYPGHTELLAERTGATQVTMLLVAPQLRIVHVSTHIPLAEAVQLVERRRIGQVIDMAHESCLLLGVAEPRIGIAGLNPHAGEGGLFGDQEAREIVPAIEAARARGLNVSSPQPPDTVFMRAVNGAYDIVVAMYHDQGHIPMKLLAFDNGVNVSIGLPIIRTSVDHGTAFDIAGTGTARPQSMLAAIDVALQMVAARQARHAPTDGIR